METKIEARRRVGAHLQDKVPLLPAEVDGEGDGFEKFVFRSLLCEGAAHSVGADHERKQATGKYSKNFILQEREGEGEREGKRERERERGRERGKEGERALTCSMCPSRHASTPTSRWRWRGFSS